MLAENNTDCFYIDGKTPSDMRTALAEKFNAGEKNIFLVSLKAGGTGLNLTGADMVIHYDPWWNPAVEEQATDRAYRIGQKKKVQVIKLIMKELNPTEGTIIVNGQNLNRMKHRNIAKYRRGLGVVFQDFRLLKDRNIYENIAFALRVTETPTRVIKKKVPAALSLVGLAQKYKSFPKELSGGEQQMLAMGRGIMSAPDLIMLDEPSLGLAPLLVNTIFDTIREIKAKKLAKQN